MRSLFPAFLALASSVSLGAQTVTIAPSDKGMRIEIDGALFTEYVTTDIQNPCFNPVLGANGAGLTREYPPAPGVKVDHPHHRGIWIGHDGVNGANFWGTGPGMGRIETAGFFEVKTGGGSASFTAKSKWLKPTGELVLDDERHFVITALPDGARQLDLAVTFLATAGDVTFRDTKEGTVGIRVAPSLAMTAGKYDRQGGGGHILTSAGVVDANAWGTRANWVVYHGLDPKNEPACITMMDHPANLRHPTWWHARNYGLFAANPFGQGAFETPPKKEPGKPSVPVAPPTKGTYVLANGQSLTLRYRFLFQKGAATAEKLDPAFAAYATMK